MRGHCYDALVGLAGCDKSLPGMMMAMVRLNVPSIFIYGGSILPGTFKGKPVTVQDVFEAVGKHSVGAMSDEDLQELEEAACPSAGSCGAQFTANTMATVAELRREEGTYPVRTHALQMGDQHPLGVGAGSLALLAALPDDDVDRLLAANEPALRARYQGFAPEILRDDLALARQR
eukprot:gene2142-2885_t